jgi:hypothetical protein
MLLQSYKKFTSQTYEAMTYYQYNVGTQIPLTNQNQLTKEF